MKCLFKKFIILIIYIDALSFSKCNTGFFYILVIYDNFGVSKGYGFVHFTSKSEYESALIEMQNAHIGSKSVRVSTAQQKR